MTASLLNERFICVNPSLIATVGTTKAVILQEIHFAETDPRIGDTDGGVLLSHQEIADNTGIKVDTVFRSLKQLETDGLVTAHSYGRTSPKTYSVNVDAVEEACEPARRELLARVKSRAANALPRYRGSGHDYREKRGSATTKNAVEDIYIEKEEKEDVGGGPADPLTDPDYEIWRNAARWMLDQWSDTTGRPKRKLTKKAVNDMRLLMTRGPTTWDNPGEVSKQEIVNVTRATMADPFWSQQIQSPGNLREYWDRLCLLVAKPKRRGVTPDEAVTHLVAAYRDVGHRGWVHMLDALNDRPELKAIAEAVGQRAFQGQLSNLEFAIRSQVRARQGEAA